MKAYLHPYLACLPIALSCSAKAGITFTDSFDGGSLGPAWTSNNSEGADSAVSGGALNVTTSGSVLGLDVARHTLQLSTGPTLDLSADWTVDSIITIADLTAFSPMGGGEGVQMSVRVRSSLPGLTDGVQINFVNLNFGGGPEFAVRGAYEVDDVETQLITNNIAPATVPLTGILRISHDSGADEITLGLDTGAGFFPLLAAALDTSTWGIADDTPLDLSYEMGLAKFGNDPAASDFTIDSGELQLNEVTIFDETLSTNTIIPEPSAAFLGLLGTAGLLIRRRR